MRCYTLVNMCTPAVTAAPRIRRSSTDATVLEDLLDLRQIRVGRRRALLDRLRRVTGRSASRGTLGPIRPGVHRGGAAALAQHHPGGQVEHAAEPEDDDTRPLD